MSAIFSTVLAVVGRTPLVRLGRLAERPDVEILAKLEYLNPGGSSKDRPLVRMVKKHLPGVKGVAADAVGSKIFDGDVLFFRQKMFCFRGSQDVAGRLVEPEQATIDK